MNLGFLLFSNNKSLKRKTYPKYMTTQNKISGFSPNVLVAISKLKTDTLLMILSPTTCQFCVITRRVRNAYNF